MEYNILLVEDDKQIREIIMDFFVEKSNGDMLLDLASDGKEGLGYIYEKEYDVIFLDVMMPRMDGFSLCREIRILFSSANVDLFCSYEETIILYVIIVFVISIVAGVFLSCIKYIRLKSAYAMEDYRRTLMDSMAHDLKSPLMAISGYAENLKENVNTDKKDYYAVAIIDNAQYMNNIIDNVLELSQLESGKVVLNTKEIKLRELINECLKKYEGIFEEKKMRIDVKGDINIRGDESLLSQAFDNLINNAIKYSEADSIIKIQIEEDKKRVLVINSCKEVLSVAPEELCKPFVKGDNARSNKLGTGIGLSISKNIFNMHGFKQNIMMENDNFVVKILL